MITYVPQGYPLYAAFDDKTKFTTMQVGLVVAWKIQGIFPAVPVMARIGELPDDVAYSMGDTVEEAAQNLTTVLAFAS